MLPPCIHQHARTNTREGPGAKTASRICEARFDMGGHPHGLEGPMAACLPSPPALMHPAPHILLGGQTPRWMPRPPGDSHALPTHHMLTCAAHTLHMLTCPAPTTHAHICSELAIEPPMLGSSQSLLNRDHTATYYADMPRSQVRGRRICSACGCGFGITNGGGEGCVC